jgi:hypothetical protein
VREAGYQVCMMNTGKGLRRLTRYLPVLFVLLSACREISFRPLAAPIPGPSPRTYESPWEAIVRADDVWLRANPPAGREQRYACAVIDLVEGDVEGAEKHLREIIMTSGDSLASNVAREILGDLLLVQYRWADFRDLHASRSPPHLFLPMAAALINQRQERVSVLLNPIVLGTTLSRVGHPLVPARINGRSQRALLDTGARFSVLAYSVAKSAGVTMLAEPAGDRQTGFTPGWGILRRLQLGDLLVEHHPVLILPDEAMSLSWGGRYESLNFSVIVGWPLLSKFTIAFDLRNRRILLTPPNAGTDSERNLFWYHRPIVRALTVQGNALSFFLDTGADLTALYPGALPFIASEVTDQRVRPGFRVGGSTLRRFALTEGFEVVIGATLLHFDRIRILDRQDRWDGRIGIDLARAGIVVVDYPNGRFEVRRR